MQQRQESEERAIQEQAYIAQVAAYMAGGELRFSLKELVAAIVISAALIVASVLMGHSLWGIPVFMLAFFSTIWCMLTAMAVVVGLLERTGCEPAAWGLFR